MVLCEIQQNYAGNFRSELMQSPKRGGFQLQAAFYNVTGLVFGDGGPAS